jgi:hypothetical protein
VQRGRAFLDEGAACVFVPGFDACFAAEHEHWLWPVPTWASMWSSRPHSLPRPCRPCAPGSVLRMDTARSLGRCCFRQRRPELSA